MADLSPAAQAVLDAAANGNINVVDDPVYKQCIAAALRALATRGEAVVICTAPGMAEFDEVIRVSAVLAIAAELEGADA